ncbi:hypothetical protein P168DRAFT_89737 [Aspergillus campestris IBT 28561]|uniref:Uncharacterized protein n=1 Tax=Aspergillus campestris (strain IBT 28561) TaxID=1392248 RepID=A0A2I1DBB9_ASPC2|nr:uncharacterized protein P168DRAFT_89737 [Aspergillus campestris IBT 28561]PKY07174.1 hypothetical protein P168DRAFT_89737 [Aspergillus campestris IBT 28561]
MAAAIPQGDELCIPNTPQYTFYLVFAVPDQNFPSLELLFQILARIRTRLYEVFDSKASIKAEDGDMILEVDAYEPTRESAVRAATFAIERGIRNWDFEIQLMGRIMYPKNLEFRM